MRSSGIAIYEMQYKWRSHRRRHRKRIGYRDRRSSRPLILLWTEYRLTWGVLGMTHTRNDQNKPDQ